MDPESLVVYTDVTEANVFNLNDHCESDYCVGAVIPFKTKVYFDDHLKHTIGHLQGHCIVVADYHKPLLYCLYTFSIDHAGDIAVQGSKALADKSTLLISAASGDYKGLEGYITSTSTTNDKHKEIFKYEISFGGDGWEKAHMDWKVSRLGEHVLLD